MVFAKVVVSLAPNIFVKVETLTNSKYLSHQTSYLPLWKSVSHTKIAHKIYSKTFYYLMQMSHVFRNIVFFVLILFHPKSWKKMVMIVNKHSHVTNSNMHHSHFDGLLEKYNSYLVPKKKKKSNDTVRRKHSRSTS